ncbi:hypothetical protein [Arthrobacter sp. QXT-31]|uniref:hypothetical protein n=1 Tax=Arthrobacter sp. QXT-31 TaxID=1357915 RepID=UPI0015607359|nr:hypothetical protein [Arthrobacter sp. QXT-31]
MSYELSVFGTNGLTADALADLIRSASIMHVEEVPDPAANGPALLTAVRGSRRVDSFSVEGPFHVEPEDVPEDVTAAVLDPQFMYQVLAVGGAQDIPHAVRFGKKLATAAGGVLVDEQTEEIWPKSSRRKSPRRESGDKPDEVDVTIYFLAEEAPEDVPARFLKLAKTYLPESFPRRFGTYEPLQGRVDRDGEVAFLAACEEESVTGMFFTTGSPVLLGRLDLPRPRYRRDIGKLSLILARDALTDAAWRRSLRRFFMGAATEFNAFFASAEVLRRTPPEGVPKVGGTELPRRPILFGEWVGLPPYPQWWNWFGPLWADTVRPYLVGEPEEHPTGLFHAWSEEPLDRDQIAALLRDPTQPWVPAQYSAVYGDGVEALRVAEVVPGRLTRNTFRTTDQAS